MEDLRKANLKDKPLTCVDRGAGFTFTKGEQRFFASKPRLVEPKRCPECRQKRKFTLVPNNGGEL